MTCHLGDFSEYAAIRNEIRDVEKEGAKARSASMRTAAAISLESLKIGDIVRIPAGRHSGLAVVVMPNRGGRGESASPAVVTEDHQLRRLTLHDVPDAAGAARLDARAQAVQRPQPQGPPRPRRDPARDDAARPAATSAPGRRRPDGRPGRRAAPADEGAPVPPLPRPREPRPLGRALVAPAARDRRHPAQDRRPHQLRRQDLRPHLRAARRDGLPRRRRPDGHR